MDEYNQESNRRKTLDEVREERRLERIEAVQEPAQRGEFNELIEAREQSLSKLKETQNENRSSHEQEVKSWRMSPASLAPAEVTLQYEGQLRGEANRHNKLIDDKLQRHDEINGKEFDQDRYDADPKYRQIIEEEIQREHTNKLQGAANTPGPQASLDRGSQEQEGPQVAVDHARLATDPEYRNQVLNNHEETDRAAQASPDLPNSAAQSRVLENEARPTSVEQQQNGTVPSVERAASRTAWQESADNILDRRENVANQNEPTAQSQNQEEKIDWQRYTQDEAYERQVNELVARPQAQRQNDRGR